MPHLLDIVERAIGQELPPLRYTYTERDVVLYALGIGAPADPLDETELRFVYELSGRGFQVLPTFALIFSKDLIAELLRGDIAGIKFNPMLMVHGEQRLQIHQALPPAATVESRATIADIQDKGSGMLLHIDIESHLEGGERLAVARSSVFIRGLGGFGGQRGKSLKIEAPRRPPDSVHEERTLPTQALLYRLAGDANPLHADPRMAAIGNYEKPILHGLCTYGFAARAILKQFAADEPARLRSISARFSQHVFPGETLKTEMWQLGQGEIRFQTTVKQRAAVVLNNARAFIED